MEKKQSEMNATLTKLCEDYGLQYSSAPVMQALLAAYNLDRESPPVTGGKKSVFCTLSDKELITKANQWMQRLIKSAGKDWMFSVQGDANSDVDLILSEVVERFESIITSPVTEQNDINVNLSENIVTTTPLRLKAIDKLGQTFLIAGREEMFCSEEIFVREPSIPDYPVCFNIKLGEIVDPNDVYLDRFCEDENWISAYRLKNKPVSMAVTGTAEEPLEAAAFRMFNERLGTDKDGAYFLGFKDGSEWQASTQSTTIERLAKALEEIAEFADSSIVVKRIAREALNSIKK